MARARSARPPAVRRDVGDHRRLDRADVGDDRARPQRRADLRGERGVGADRHAEDDEIGVRRRLGGSRARVWPSPSASARASTPGRRRRRRCAGSAGRAAARAIEEPIRPTPISAIVGNSGSARRGSGIVQADRKCAQRRDDAGIGVLVADGQAQAIRHAVAVHAAQDEAGGGQRRVGAARLARVGEADQQEIAVARRNLQAERRDFAAQPRQPARVVGVGRREMLAIAERRGARRLRRRIDVERPADAVERVDHVARRIGPAEPQRPPARRPWRRCAA